MKQTFPSRPVPFFPKSSESCPFRCIRGQYIFALVPPPPPALKSCRNTTCQQWCRIEVNTLLHEVNTVLHEVNTHVTCIYRCMFRNKNMRSHSTDGTCTYIYTILVGISKVSVSIWITCTYYLVFVLKT